MSKILVTGGAGFIGSTLADKLIAEGHNVVVIDDLSSGKRGYLNPAAKFYQTDIASSEVAEIFKTERFDFVYHLAAQIEVIKSMADPKRDNAINVLGGFNILENARLSGVKKIIFASTGGAIYGDASKIPTPESYPAYPLSFYGIHKLTYEKYLNCYYRVYGLDYTVLRFANVYGPRQFKGGEAGVIAIFIDNAVKGRESVQNGDGRQTRDFVYVDDVAASLLKAKEVAYQGEINIGSGIETSLLDIRRDISKALGAPMAVKEGPAKPGEQRRSCLSPKLAKKILGWEPEVKLEEGIRRTIVWARSVNN
ncbi:MAG: NAD-dependent epimerase/dehydratase family protein [Candidatus Falkowbacteria bacterium]|nr:NAD-dependent epimerase/dehydratase family protein [Candidatus Falkowbacteria bacterium]